jgi:hypothetical protein
VSVSCVAPDEATAREIEAEAQEYFRIPPQTYLIPPWVPGDPRTPQQRDRDRSARRTYLRVEEALALVQLSPEALAENQKLIDARRGNDAAEIERLEAEQLRRWNEAQRDAIAQLKGDAMLDRGVIEEVLLHGLDDPAEAQLREHWRNLGRHMGQLPLTTADEPAPGSDRYSRLGGSVSRDGRKLSLRWVAFTSLSDAAPALVGWLDQKGCSGFRYVFHGGGATAEVDSAGEDRGPAEQ